jgi:hypothetical protein
LIAENTVAAGTGGANGNSGSTAGPDVNGTVGTSDFNLIGNSSGFNANVVTGDILDPSFIGLGPLANNGGPTQTMALLPGSPAIDAGAFFPGVPSTDQRDVTRPQDSEPDIGAFESQGFTITIAGGNNQSTLPNTPFTNPLRVVVQPNDPEEPVAGGQITFTPPSSGASAALSPATPVTIASDGTASVTATANGTFGSYNVTANTRGAVGPATFSLQNQASTSTAVVSSATNNSSVYGQYVTFTATVSNTTPGSSATPTGSVQFVIDGIDYGSTVPLVNGQASISDNLLTVSGSPHSIVADYLNSDGDFQKSNGNLTNGQIVTPAQPTVKVADTGGVYNQSQYFATATVAGVVAGVDSTPASSLEGVNLTLDYVQLNSNGTTTDLGSTAPYLPGSYTVTASFAGSADYTKASATTPQFTISSPLPTITPFLTSAITGQAVGVPGQPLTDTFAVNGPTQGISFSINYGDGTPLTTTAAGGPTITLDHIYTTTGSFTITVTAMDQKGWTSQQATLPVTIGTVEMENDPSGGTALAVGGTLGNDTIILSPADSTGGINVKYNGSSLGNFKPTGHILVYGQSGNDTIQLKSNTIGTTTYYIAVPAFLYGGGTGNDTLDARGSTANNVLTGGGGMNSLYGGLGRDLLIAGLGTSQLKAGSSDDILIGGWTNYDLTSSGMTYDQKLGALEAIMAEWGSTDSYATRVNDLLNPNSGGLNGPSLLNTSTVHENGQVDTLIGTTGAAFDWLLAGLTDVIQHKKTGEVQTTIF